MSTYNFMQISTKSQIAYLRSSVFLEQSLSSEHIS